MPFQIALGECHCLNGSGNLQRVDLKAIDLEHALVAQSPRIFVEGVVKRRGDQRDPALGGELHVQVLTYGDLVTNQQMLGVRVAGHLHDHFDARGIEPVLLEIGRLLVHDAEDLQVAQAPRNARNGHLIRFGGHG
jgi:hypothetical protein